MPTQAEIDKLNRYFTAIQSGGAQVLSNATQARKLLASFTASPDGPQPEPDPKPEPQPPAKGVPFGFQLDLNNTGQTDLAAFKKDCDLIKAAGGTYTRFGMGSWQIGQVNGTSVTLDQASAATVRAGLQYARSIGLKNYYLTSDASILNPDSPDYNKMLGNYLKAQARAFGEYVDVWQVFNEVNGASAFDWESAADVRAGSPYMVKLRAALKSAADAIHAEHPGVKVTTNALGWPMNDAMEQDWRVFFDGIGDVLDIICVDTYPATSDTEIGRLPGRIRALQSRYGKPVMIGEVGLQTDGYGQSNVNEYLPKTLAALKSASPAAVIIYKLRRVDDDAAFGIVNADGTPGPAWGPSIDALTR